MLWRPGGGLGRRAAALGFVAPQQLQCHYAHAYGWLRPLPQNKWLRGNGLRETRACTHKRAAS